jgi:transposase
MWREFMPNTNSYGGSFTIPKQLHVDELSFTADLLTIYASTTDLAAECPLCGQLSLRIHGCYMRTLADLPWCGTPVRLRVRVRKFFCDEPSCERKIFAERLEEVTRPFARATDRQRDALEWIALALGGEAGARLARELGLLVSPDTLLNRIRGAFCADGVKNVVRVLGVDDFGLGRDGVPGTIMVDLERHRIVDLLEEHSVESLAKWLSQHPNVEVVSRDRSHICREGIAAGAPQATQIADRWHLLRNLAEKLDEFLGQKRPILEAAARPPTQPETEGDEDSLPEGSEENLYEDPGAPGPLTPDRPRPGYAHRQQVSRKHYELVVERWQEIRRLHKAGTDVTGIARKLGTSRPTVYRYKDLAEPPEFGQHRRRGSVLDPWVPYILKRWEEGCRNGKKLFREIRERGYSYSESNVGRLVAELRRADGLTTPDSSGRRRTASDTAAWAPGTRHIVSLFLRRPEKLTEEQAAYLDRLRVSDVAVGVAYELSQRFVEMIRNLDGERLEEWLTHAESCEAPALRRFATSLNTDLGAVRAGLTESWNNGPVEGFIHKLKLVKRQGYGRANIDLLKARVMAA